MMRTQHCDTCISVLHRDVLKEHCDGLPCFDLQVPMDQGANALDMITKFTRNQPLVETESILHLASDEVKLADDLLGRKSGPADMSG